MSGPTQPCFARHYSSYKFISFWCLDRGGSRIFLGGGALVSCSASTPINHIFFFLHNTSCIRKPQVISGRGTHPLHPPLRSVPAIFIFPLGIVCGPFWGWFAVWDHLRYCAMQLASGSELKDYESRHTSEMKITVRQFILEPRGTQREYNTKPLKQIMGLWAKKCSK